MQTFNELKANALKNDARVKYLVDLRPSIHLNSVRGLKLFHGRYIMNRMLQLGRTPNFWLSGPSECLCNVSVLESFGLKLELE